MAKILECVKVDPSSGCQHIVRERVANWAPNIEPGNPMTLDATIGWDHL